MSDNTDLIKALRDIPDFPKPGIIFKDITPVLADSALFAKVIRGLAESYEGKEITKVVGIESRGFIFGAALAYALGVGFIPARKKGKLPYKTISASFALEYGKHLLLLLICGKRKGKIPHLWSCVDRNDIQAYLR